MQVLSVKQAAAELGVTCPRIIQLITHGRLKATRLGREWMIAPKDLDGVRNRPTGRPPKARKGGAQ